MIPIWNNFKKKKEFHTKYLLSLIKYIFILRNSDNNINYNNNNNNDVIIKILN